MPYLPITPDQIAEEAFRAYEAGAAIVHVHAREPKTEKTHIEFGNMERDPHKNKGKM